MIKQLNKEDIGKYKREWRRETKKLQSTDGWTHKDFLSSLVHSSELHLETDACLRARMGVSRAPLEVNIMNPKNVRKENILTPIL